MKKRLDGLADDLQPGRPVVKWELLGAFPEPHRINPEPPSGPPLAAYSYSASVGKRYAPSHGKIIALLISFLLAALVAADNRPASTHANHCRISGTAAHT